MIDIDGDKEVQDALRRVEAAAAEARGILTRKVESEVDRMFERVGIRLDMTKQAPAAEEPGFVTAEAHAVNGDGNNGGEGFNKNAYERGYRKAKAKGPAALKRFKDDWKRGRRELVGQAA